MHRYFSTPPIFSAPVGSIDRENGIIRGVTIAQVGPAKGHGGFVDKTFLLQLVDNASSKPAGIKARYGHPNMCTTALGTYLGRFKNYSYSSDKVNADLYLDNTSRSTPNGDLYTYILDMAEKNPDMFGASIVFEIAESVFLKEEMDEKKVEKEYFRLKELRATDIVDEPAATDGLFSENTYAGIATQFLDENPDVMELILSKPDSLIEFLSNYLTNSKMNLSEKIKENFASFLAAFSTQPTEPSALSTQHSALSSEHSEDTTLNSLFDAVSASYPDSFTEVEGFTQLQKAEALTTFFSSVNDKLQLAVDTERRLLSEAEALNSEIVNRKSEIVNLEDEITTLREQLSARPSIPLNVTDPALSLSTSQEKDETGKQILAALPKDLKRQLKKQS